MWCWWYHQWHHYSSFVEMIFRDSIWLTPVLLLVLASLSCAIDNAIVVMWCWCQWQHISKKSWSISISWTRPKECNCAYGRYHWCHVTWTLMASHDHKGHVAPYFNHRDVRSAMMLLPMALPSHDTNANFNGVTCPEIVLHLISIVLTRGMQWFHWWCHCQSQWCGIVKNAI